MQIKRCLFFVLSIFVPYLCYGDAYDDTYNELAKDSTFSPLIKYEEFIKHSLPIIEARMMQVDSELVKSSKNDTKEQKIVKYNNRLAQKVFDDYKNYFFEDIKKKSKETGRKIQPDGEIKPGAKHVWLDRGILDTEQCNSGTYIPKDGSEIEIEKVLRDTMEHTCLYPDGFETYDIEVKDGVLHVDKDDKIKGVHTKYHIAMSNLLDLDYSKDIGSFVSIDIDKNVFDYNEYHKYRNTSQQEIKNGLYGPGPIPCYGAECDDLEKLTIGPTTSVPITGNKLPKNLLESMRISRSINFTKD